MNHYFLAFYRPADAFRRLVSRENHLALGFAFILVPIAGYTLMYIFLTIFRTLLWSAYAIYFAAFFVLFPLAVRVVHGLKWGRSIAIGVSGFVLFQLIFLVFNR